MSARFAFAVASVVLFVGCGDVSQSVSTPPAKHASEVGAYTAAQLRAARDAVRTCPKRKGWRCGFILASFKGEWEWAAVVVRDDGIVTTVESAWNGPTLDAKTGVAEYPPGVLVEWSTAGNDNRVAANEIEVIR